MVVPDDAATGMLARDLPPLEIERIPVAVSRRLPKHGHAPVVFNPAHLSVVGNVAPHEIAALAAPCRALAPQSSSPQPLDRRIAEPQRIERGIDRDDVGIGVGHRLRAGREVRGGFETTDGGALRAGCAGACCGCGASALTLRGTKAATPAAVPIFWMASRREIMAILSIDDWAIGDWVIDDSAMW